MESAQPPKASANLFQVFLRLRPSPEAGGSHDRFLAVEDPESDTAPTRITLNPPNDRRRAVEKFAFTQVFEEDATQLDVFHCTGIAPLIEGVVAPHGGPGTDGLVATLGVTGSGKSHTILGSRSQRGLTQLALDVIFRSLGTNLLDPSSSTSLESSLQASDASEASVVCAATFLEGVFADPLSQSRGPGSRAATPAIVGPPPEESHSFLPPPLLSLHRTPVRSPKSVRLVDEASRLHHACRLSPIGSPFSPTPTPKRAQGSGPDTTTRHYMTLTAATRVRKVTKTGEKSEYAGFSNSTTAATPARRLLQPPSAFPQTPDVSAISVSADPSAEYAVVLSMYEVYNDRIFDLLTPPIRATATKDLRRRPLVFKSTETSPDRKVVAGLRKVVCGSLHDALMVLEAGLHERRVAGTVSNSVSSRSHGFIRVEVKKRQRGRRSSSTWGGNALTVVDLAGSERARDAKTQGATLAEAGKINESLMYLGQCLQMQSDSSHSSKPNIVPFRQCKLTELLFSNSFPSASSTHQRRNPQRAVMIVTADPVGDFNATSQILRYSALAREVTVPRIPSIYSNQPAPAPPPALGAYPVSPTLSRGGDRGYFRGPSSGSHRNISPRYSPGSSSSDDRATMEIAALEIARLSEEVDGLRAELGRESDARAVAEAHLVTLEDRTVDLEQLIREDCVDEFEKRLAAEMERWKANLALQVERGEEHWNRKAELLERGLVGVEAEAAEDDKENVLVEDMEEEMERLRRENAVLKRELGCRSPTRRVPLQAREDVLQRAEVESLGSRMERLRVGGEDARGKPAGIPKKVRRLQQKRWEDAGADDF